MIIPRRGMPMATPFFEPNAGLRLNPNSGSYPAGVATDLTLPPATDRYSATLTAPITNTDTSIPVSIVPANLPVIISVGAEEILCDTAAGLVLHAVTRGFNGTSAAEHPAGIGVFGNVVSYYVNQLSAEVKAIEADLFSRAYSVAQAGAKGDGVTNDAPAFAAAIASGAKLIRVPAIDGKPTTYVVGSTVNVNTPLVKIIGDGSDLVTLKFAGAMTNMFRVTADNFSIEGVTIDGDFKSGTSPYQIGIWATNVSGVSIIDVMFKRMGYPTAPNYESIGYGNTHSILIDATENVRILFCRHYTNFGVDVQITASSRIVIRDNQMGTDRFSDAATATNYWDTHSPAPGGYYVQNCRDVHILNNKIYGGMRFFDTWGKGGPIRAVQCSNLLCDGNYVTGFTIGFGTLNCTNGSATVIGVNTSFSTLDPTWTNGDGNMLIDIEHGGQYRIQSVTSPTSIVLKSAFAGATATALRYRITTSGDLLGASPVVDSVVSNNVLEYSGDMGLSLGGQALTPFSNNIIANNKVSYCRITGMILDGATSYSIFANNLFHSNHQITNMIGEGARGAIGFLPRPGEPNVYNMFIGNSAIDDQGVITQPYLYDVDTANLANIGLNSHVSGVLANSALTNLTPDQFAQAFSQAVPISEPRFCGRNATGAGSALLGANCPAGVLTAPYTWAHVTTADGSAGWIPIWK